MKKKKIFQLTFSILFSTLLVVSLVYAWTAPSQNPPGGNVEAPINVSDAAQSKLGNFGLGGGAGQPLYWLKNVGGTLYFSSTNPAGDRVVIGQDGNVGIGTTSPVAKLTIPEGSRLSLDDNADDRAIFVPIGEGEPLVLSNHSAAANPTIRFRDDSTGADKMVVNIATGNVGIGTTNPSAPLQVRSDGNGNPAVQGLYVFNPDNAAGENSVIGIRVGGSSAGDPYLSWDIKGEYGWSMGIDNDDRNKLKIGRNWNSISANPVLTIDTSGNVGIGTTNPQAKLHVNGRIKAQDPVDDNDVATRGWVLAQVGSYTTCVNHPSSPKTEKDIPGCCEDPEDAYYCPSGWTAVVFSRDGCSDTNWDYCYTACCLTP